MGVLASAPVRGQYGGVVRQRLKGHEQAVAVVSADGRSCSARPIDGGGLGCVAGPAVLATSELDVRTALNWMPGRILVLAEAALEPRALGLVVPSAHMATLLGLVLLGEDDLDLIVKRVEALSDFLATDDGQNLLAGVKRASNILKIEEKKDGREFTGAPEVAQLVKGEEKALHRAISQTEANARKAAEAEDFTAAMSHIAKLRGPVDDFFEKVQVNDPNPSYRENRLKLLNRIREATLAVADFSKIEG